MQCFMVQFPLIFGLGGWEILIIVFVILLLFGGAKIPELMKGLGKGVKSFKEGLKDDEKDDASKKEENNVKADRK